MYHHPASNQLFNSQKNAIYYYADKGHVLKYSKEKGAKACSNLYKQQHHLKVSDRGLVSNSDLIELQNLLINGSQTIVAAENRKKSRGADALDDFPDPIDEYDYAQLLEGQKKKSYDKH